MDKDTSFYEQKAETNNYFYLTHSQAKHCPTHYHGAVEFLFLAKGEIEVTLDGETRTLRAGEGYFADSFSVHSYRLNTDVETYVLVADKRYFERFFEEQNGLTFPPFFTYESHELLDNLLAIYRSCACISQKNGFCRGLCETFIYSLAEKIPLGTRKKGKSANLVGKILSYAHDNLNGDLSLETLSRQFGYTREHLSRLIHSHLKEHWNSYVSRIRAIRVHELLKNTDGLTVMEIALSCGFENANTFYRAYKKAFGETPKKKGQ